MFEIIAAIICLVSLFVWMMYERREFHKELARVKAHAEEVGVKLNLGDNPISVLAFCSNR